MRRRIALPLALFLFSMNGASAEGHERSLTWSIDSGDRVTSLTLTESGHAEISQGGALRQRSYTADQTEDAFEAAERLLEVLPKLVHQKTPAAGEEPRLKRLGGSRQSSELTTRLRIQDGPITGSVEITNLPALMSEIDDEELAKILRAANEILGAFLSQR